MLNADLIIGVFAFLFGGVILSVTRGLSKLGGVFVDYVLVAIFFLGAMMLAKGFIKPERLAFFESVVERNNILIGLVILFLYLIIMPKVGFLPASYVFYACFNIYLAEDRWTTRNILQSMGLSAVLVSFFYAMFHYVLLVPLPEGTLFN